MQIYFMTLLPMLVLACIGWLLSLKNNNVTVVDSLWAMFFLMATAMTFSLLSGPSDRAYLILLLVGIWSIRLSTYLHLRNHNKAEDLRYQAIRARNEPHFRYKSIYLVFILQAFLAWFISLPLNLASQSTSALNTLDWIGVSFWILGMGFQVIGDAQLSQFKSKLDNKGKVLDTGVWRYTRHPNYFGESCIWLGYGLIAMAAGAGWGMISSAFMIYLLIKVTGVKLLEADIAERRPGYKDYVQKTNAFLPWFPKGE
jgi:steroid 5-alpha reductase family enzyme